MKREAIQLKILEMANNVSAMSDLIERGFIEHNLDALTEAMKREGAINDAEKALTTEILALAKDASAETERKKLVIFEQAVETLERMGDEAANLVERIEIKVHERLMFNDTAVMQYNETYAAMKKSVRLMVEYLDKHDPGLKRRVVDSGFNVKGLVERYRKEHAQRLIKGLCTPMGANLYFDMLDFTGNLARHASNVIKLF